MYLYLKALHIIFVVTWFAGLFYIGRLLIYLKESQSKDEIEREILTKQLTLMMNRLWKIITWPSAILTLIFGTALWTQLGYTPNWLWVKVGFLLGLYLYHISIHILVQQSNRGIFSYSSYQLRMWNEIPTVFLISIVMLAIVKQSFSWVYGLMGLVVLLSILFLAIRLYKKYREK